jgi:hypothetical protein
MSFPVQLAIARGAPSKIEGIKLTATERKLIALLHVDEAEWIKNREMRRRGGDFLSRTSLGRRIGGGERSDDDENRTSMPTFSGFRESR